MRFDIVTLDNSYRGVERSLNTDDLLSKKAKVYYDKSINYYFKYLDLIYNAQGVSYNLNTFNELLIYYKKFKSYGINCEIIAYNNSLLNDVFGWQIKLLGVDIVNNFYESLLEDTNGVHDIIKSHLNPFGLLQKAEDIDIVLKNSLCGNYHWMPCWVYKVNV